MSEVSADVITLYFGRPQNEDGLRKVGYLLNAACRSPDRDRAAGRPDADSPGDRLFRGRPGRDDHDRVDHRAVRPTPRPGAHGGRRRCRMSAKNLTALDEAGLGFIVGSRTTKAPTDLALPLPLARRRLHRRADHRHHHPKNSRIVENDAAKKAEPVWNPQESTPRRGGRCGLASAKTRCARQQDADHPGRTEARRPGEKKAKTTRFVKTSGDKRVLDHPLAVPAGWPGSRDMSPNIPATRMDAAEVIASYHRPVARVEQSFRMSKTDLRARPMFRLPATRSKPTSPSSSPPWPSAARPAQNRTAHSDPQPRTPTTPTAQHIAIARTQQTFPARHHHPPQQDPRRPQPHAPRTNQWS